jgi:hypothetical protein
MRKRSAISSALFLALTAAIFCSTALAQGVKRIVIVKVDGLPAYYVDKFVRLRDQKTGKSVLPWFDEVFYKNGTRVANFYTRGMSLSGPSWGQLDTGQHLQIKGNVEYDRFTLRAYDYLNFFPYYVAYGLGKKVDMPATEVMDQLRIPLLCDAFNYSNRYTSQQLYQRGNDWAVLASGFLRLYPGNPAEFIDEWTMGLDYRKVTIDQNERDILGKLVKRPDIDYFDYYEVAFDHASHHNNDDASRLIALKDLDRLVGRIWEANKASSRADETALIVISDHGFNSEEKVYSQGFNLVKLLAGSAGGGHHVITKRRLMLDYSIKGLYPFVPLITTTSNESRYLKYQGNKYPTALVDFDGNERSSIHLRNNDLNILHILLQQLTQDRLAGEVKAAVTDTVFQIVEKHRSEWKRTVDELTEELDALHRWRLSQEKLIPTLPDGPKHDRSSLGVREAKQRVASLAAVAEQNEYDYRKYTATLANLAGLSREALESGRLNIEDLIAPGAMGEANSLYELQNYVVGISSEGLTLGADKQLDLGKSLARINYFQVLHDQKVRNNVQAKVASRPIDFVAVRVPVAAFGGSLGSGVVDDPIWLYSGDDRQVLLLSRIDAKGSQSYRYLPLAGLREDPDGRVSFEARGLGAGFPLKYFEDPNLGISVAERAAWLGEWHSESEWMNAVHMTAYSNAIVGLNEQLDRHPVFDLNEKDLTTDETLIRRFRQRQRHLTEADLLVLANNHWNFDVRGFNPGGNHGSFFRASTNSTFLIAGGDTTGIPRGLKVAAPYDSLSFMPTVLRLMGKVDEENRPIGDLAEKGFRPFPGPVISEITGGGKPAEK